ncbi:hypothetical protein [Sphaerospermopsis torques-reginae]|uniref:Uncharacterized protein n=1 Tax=Sphaerospermopsis torques-reginae ITEP-024 TaxID=984208 RepID=A0ABX8WYX1_9CYAN|nr:hypothetical protein [Sphaerospermopsis torques-reginae]QYX31618.1 hypothetical protein K2F26_23000 [Sphaerospermopsis torques-reginae ITEP-024]
MNRITGILGTDKEAQDVPRASSKYSRSQESEVKLSFCIGFKLDSVTD